MTAVNIATQIPNSITTVEQLAVWCGKVLGNLNSDVVAVEGVNYAQNAAQTGTFFIAATNSTRHITRLSIAMDPAYLVGGAKPWLYAQEISQKPLTAAMTSN